MISSQPASRPWWITVLLPVVCGLAFATAFPPWGLKFVTPLALGGFLWCLSGLGPVQARCAGFCFGMAMLTFGCHWLGNIFGNLFLVLTALHGLFYGLFGWAHAIIDRQSWKVPTKALAIACVWTGVEYIRAEHFWLDFPWMTPGHALGVIPVLTQPLLCTIGVYGVGFVVVLVCGLVVRSHTQWKSPIGPTILVLWMVAEGFSIPATNLHYFLNGFNKPLRKVTFAAIQSESGSLGRFYEQTEALNPKPQLVIWPEESLPYDVEKSKLDWPMLNELIKKQGCTLVLGTQQTIPKGGWYNTALTLDETGLLGIHHKIHTVHLFDDGTPGTTATPVATKLGRIGTPICFDNDSEDVVRHMTAAGAEFFAVPSMDPMNWGPIQREQHSELFRIRAAENGRAMVVCATSGVTQVIDGWGQNYQPRNPDGTQRPFRLEAMKPGVLTGEIPARTGFTLYTQGGWLFPWLALAGAVVFVGAGCRGR